VTYLPGLHTACNGIPILPEYPKGLPFLAASRLFVDIPIILIDGDLGYVW